MTAGSVKEFHRAFSITAGFNTVAFTAGGEGSLLSLDLGNQLRYPTE